MLLYVLHRKTYGTSYPILGPGFCPHALALQNEFSIQENIALARQFLLDNFVSRGMVVDFAVHSPDKEDGGISNPHFHVMCPI
ncbi:MAG: MobA/MobL family protein, partial [Tissierellia bacterium]|nr:MobA/MobL family protein [Tissierellia bacterium]